MSLPDELAAAIEQYRVDHRLKSEAEALRVLLRLGLAASRAGFAPVLESTAPKTFDQLRAMLREFEHGAEGE